jgi:hypothetical protein
MADAAEVAGLKQLIHRFCCMSLTSKKMDFEGLRQIHRYRDNGSNGIALTEENLEH